MSILGLALGFLVPCAGIGGFTLRMLAPAMFSRFADPVVARAKSIPPKGWLAIGVTLLLVAGFFVHRHYARAALEAAYASGKADEGKAWAKRLDAMRAAALRWRAKAEEHQADISKEIGAHHETALRDIAARADDQRLRGPGQAAAPACVGSVQPARIPGAAGGHDPASGQTDPGLAGLPPESRLAIVPWSGLVNAAQLGDDWRAEVIAWREWYARQAEANRQARETAPK